MRTKFLVNYVSVKLSDSCQFFLPRFVKLSQGDKFAFLPASNNMGLILSKKEAVDDLIKSLKGKAEEETGLKQSKYFRMATTLSKTEYQTFDAEWHSARVSTRWLGSNGMSSIKQLMVYQMREVLENGTFRDSYYVCSPFIFNVIRDKFPVWEENGKSHKR